MGNLFLLVMTTGLADVLSLAKALSRRARPSSYGARVRDTTFVMFVDDHRKS